MRDIVLVLVFLALLVRVFRTPAYGAFLWAWLSLMNPHKLSYGFAYSFPFAQITALLTMTTAVFSRKRQPVPMFSVTWLWLALVLWMSLTSLFALNSSEVVFDRWLFVFKIHVMLFVSLMLIVDPKQLRILVVVVTFSVAFFGIKGGIFTALTGGSYRVWGPPDGMLAGNNELAVGLITLVPFLYWMRETVTRAWLRPVLLICIVLSVLAVLGSQSRGALLAIFAMVFLLGLKSRHPVRMSVMLMFSMVAAIAFMPDSWTQRMDTIAEYNGDTSALSRLWTWTTLFNAAVDRPLVGAGFRADSLVVFRLYAPLGGKWEIFSALDKVWVAHSIYFQMLGEHGFVGLFIYLSLWITVWLHAGRLAKQAEGYPDLASWLPLLMRMTQVGLVGFAVGGAFLSLAYLDLPFYYMGYVILAHRFVAASANAPNSLPAVQVPAMHGRTPQMGARG